MEKGIHVSNYVTNKLYKYVMIYIIYWRFVFAKQLFQKKDTWNYYPMKLKVLKNFKIVSEMD